MQRNYRIGNDDYPAVVAVNPDGTPIGSSAATPSTTPVTVADGADVAEGAKADALATNSTGSWSVVALLKGIYAQLVLTVTGLAAATPAGSNVIGKVQVADGGDTAQGAVADAAYTGTGSGSIVALLKGLYVQLVAPTPAGTNVIGKVQVADGGNSTQGFTTDTPLAATATTASASMITLLKGIFNTLLGVLTIRAAIWWQEANNTAVGANGTFTGSSRIGNAAGVAGPNAYFTAWCSTTQPGTLIVGNGIFNTNLAIAAGSSGTLKLPAFGPGMTAFFTNGSTAGNITLFTGFTSA